MSWTLRKGPGAFGMLLKKNYQVGLEMTQSPQMVDAFNAVQNCKAGPAIASYFLQNRTANQKDPMHSSTDKRHMLVAKNKSADWIWLFLACWTKLLLL